MSGITQVLKLFLGAVSTKVADFWVAIKQTAYDQRMTSLLELSPPRRVRNSRLLGLLNLIIGGIAA